MHCGAQRVELSEGVALIEPPAEDLLALDEAIRQLQAEKLVLSVGYSHPVEIVPPPGISFVVETPTRIGVTGIDKQLVGEIAANIRRIRKPEPYKGKGIRYTGEVVRRKAGKAGKVGGKKK